MFDLLHLPGGQADEHTVALLRRHWITLGSLSFSLIIVVILPFGIFFGLSTLQPELLEDPVKFPLVILGLSVFFLFAWLFLFQNFIDYYLDMWIVTNKRILNIEQHGLFARTVSELRLHRIQDVTSEVHGFMPSMLDYGNVYIQTAGEKERFSFETIPHPNQTAKIILDLAEIERRSDLVEAIEEFNLPDSKK